MYDFPNVLVTFKTLQFLINLVDFLTLQTDDKYPHMDKSARRPCLSSLERYNLLHCSSFFKDMQSYFMQWPLTVPASYMLLNTAQWQLDRKAPIFRWQQLLHRLLHHDYCVCRRNQVLSRQLLSSGWLQCLQSFPSEVAFAMNLSSTVWKLQSFFPLVISRVRTQVAADRRQFGKKAFTIYFQPMNSHILLWHLLSSHFAFFFHVVFSPIDTSVYNKACVTSILSQRFLLPFCNENGVMSSFIAFWAAMLSLVTYAANSCT